MLLTSSTILHTLREQPTLLDRLWGFVTRPAPLDTVQLQYWCRVAGSLLLRDSGAISGGSPPNSPTASAVAPLLPKLLRHMYSDSVCLLVKCLLGLPIAADLHGSAAEAEPGCGALHGVAAGGFSMRTALSGEHSVLPACVELVLEGGECAANAAELLCTICRTLPDRPDALELRSVFVPSFMPLIAEIFDACLAPREADAADSGCPAPPPLNSAARIGALKVAAAALVLEQRCAALTTEQMSCLPTELFMPDATEAAAAPNGAVPPCTAPFARLLAPRLDALRIRLLDATSLQQLQTAELLATVLQTAPAWMHEPLCLANLPETAVTLFLQSDVNGGGRQDFVRHVILRGLRATLACPDPTPLHHRLLVTAELPQRMLRAVTSTSRKAPPREYIRLLHLELVQAAEAAPSIHALLTRNSAAQWLELGHVLTGGSPTLSATTGSPMPTSPLLPSPMGAAAPAELFIAADADADADDATMQADEDVASPPPGGSAADARVHPGTPMPGTPTPGTPTGSRGAPPVSPKQEQSDECSADTENIDPNSPPSSKRPRSRSGNACGTPRPRTLPLDGGSASPFDSASTHECGIASLPPPPSSPPMVHSPVPRSAAVGVGAIHPGTPRPDGLEGDMGTNSLRFVEDSTLRSAEDFSRDTPQPKLVRRAYLHRKAKENFGAFTPGASPGGASSPSSSPSRSKRGAHAAHAGLQASPGAAASSPPAGDEDSSLTQLRSSVRSLCF